MLALGRGVDGDMKRQMYGFARRDPADKMGAAGT